MTTETAGERGRPREVRADPMPTAEHVLELVRTQASDAEAEVTVERGTAALTRFATSFIHQNVAEETNHVVLRVAIDGRTATARLDGPADAAALVRLVEGALESARVRPVDPDWPGVAPIAAAPDVDHWDEATAAATPDDRARLVGDFVAAANGLETAGACSTSATTVAFANSGGQRLTSRTTRASLDGIARTGSSDGSGRASSATISAIDGRQVGERAARKAGESRDPSDLEPGRYEVVLEPQCVTNMLQFLFVYGFNGKPVEEGRSFVRFGEAQFDKSITLSDDVTDPRMVGIGFDIEGTPKRRTDVVRDGITSAVLHTRRTARKAGTESTGNAVEDGDAWGALAGNPALSPGDRTDEELIRRVGRGLLVTDFWYVRILDPKTQVVTGLTRNGVWLIEDGRVVRPVSNLRFTQSYLEALGPGAVRGIGRERALIPGGFEGEWPRSEPSSGFLELHRRRQGLTRRQSAEAGDVLVVVVDRPLHQPRGVEDTVGRMLAGASPARLAKRVEDLDRRATIARVDREEVVERGVRGTQPAVRLGPRPLRAFLGCQLSQPRVPDLLLDRDEVPDDIGRGPLAARHRAADGARAAVASRSGTSARRRRRSARRSSVIRDRGGEGRPPHGGRPRRPSPPRRTPRGSNGPAALNRDRVLQGQLPEMSSHREPSGGRRRNPRRP